MNVIATRPMTVEQFLEWEERQDQRYEFDGVRPVAMNGGTRAHNIIALNLASLLSVQLRGSSFQPYAAGMKLQVGGRVRYPDVLVGRSSTAMSETAETAPLVVFEVLSRGTATVDRTVKLAEYRRLLSLRRYVMLEQTRIAATVIVRTAVQEGVTAWVQDVILTPNALLGMPEIGIELRLGDLYEGVALPDLDAEDVVDER